MGGKGVSGELGVRGEIVTNCGQNTTMPSHERQLQVISPAVMTIIDVNVALGRLLLKLGVCIAHETLTELRKTSFLGKKRTKQL